MTREEAFAESVRRYRMPFGPLVWMDTSTNTQRLDWDAAFEGARRQVAVGVRP